jgi:spermidine/putrescine transport system permease protein
MMIWVYAIGVLVFLYLPAVVVIIYSFSKETTLVFPITGFSTKWYTIFLHDRQLLDALKNSLLVALSSISIGLIVGIPAAFALDRYHIPGKKVIEKTLLLPFVMPGVITGILLLSFFLLLGVKLSLFTVIIGHSVLMIAVVITEVSVGLKRWDRTLEEASKDLGADELRTFLHVIFPNLQPVIIGAVLLGLTLSLDEITRTFFLTGTENTLPIKIWGMMKMGITPEINAVATIIFLFSAAIVITWTMITKEG